MLRRPVAVYRYQDLDVLASSSSAGDLDLLRKDAHLKAVASELFALLDATSGATRPWSRQSSPTSVAEVHRPPPPPPPPPPGSGGDDLSSPRSPRRKKKREAEGESRDRSDGPEAYAGSLASFAAARGLDYRHVPLLRRIAHCAAARSSRSPRARVAITEAISRDAPLAAVKALSVCAAGGLAPQLWGSPAGAGAAVDVDVDDRGLWDRAVSRSAASSSFLF